MGGLGLVLGLRIEYSGSVDANRRIAYKFVAPAEAGAQALECTGFQASAGTTKIDLFSHFLKPQTLIRNPRFSILPFNSRQIWRGNVCQAACDFAD